VRPARSLSAAVPAALSCLGALCAFAALPGAAGAATLNATPSSLSSVYAAAKPGDLVQLAAGSYPTFKGASKAAPGVTVRAASGATVTMAGAQFVGTSYITLQGVKFTSGVVIRDNANHIVLDGDTFDGLGTATWEGRLSLNLGAHDNIVRNSHFGNGGCSDGVFVGNATKNTIGPGNEFSAMHQGSCAEHVDSIQLYTGPQTTITGNYFHDITTGIMAPNGTSGATLTNNVFVMTEYPYAAYFGWSASTTAVHNTIVGGSLHFEDWTNGTDHPSAHTSGTVRDNVLAGGIQKIGVPTGALVQDYNLLSSGAAGSHDLTGTPTFVGGAKPTTYAGYALASGSKGKANASDGTDRGIKVGATTPPAAPPATPPADKPARAVWTVPANVRVGQAVTLDATRSTGDGTLTCTWSFEDQAGTKVWETATGCKLIKTFKNADTKYVKLTVRDADGDTNASRQSFAVTP
jgi:PKD domain